MSHEYELDHQVAEALDQLHSLPHSENWVIQRCQDRDSVWWTAETPSIKLTRAYLDDLVKIATLASTPIDIPIKET